MRLDENKIKLLMAEKCLSANEVAEQANLTRQTISAVLGGKSCYPATAGKIARALNVEVIEIVEVR